MYNEEINKHLQNLLCTFKYASHGVEMHLGTRSKHFLSELATRSWCFPDSNIFLLSLSCNVLNFVSCK